MPAINSSKVVWAGDVDSGRAEVGQNVVVVGAGLTGVETAVNLASQGKKVTVIEMMGPEVVLATAPSAHKFYLLDRIKEFGIRIIPNARMEGITENSINVINKDFQWREYEADSIVLAMGMRPRKEKVTELRHLIPETDVFIVGDCLKPGSLFTANHDGFNAACEI
jgi:pyruvate/2-oxoglutarate dehydrogenase complex dihydrolipoamide dehydrogenase (E3) component